MTQIRAFEEISREDYVRLSNELSEMFEAAGAAGESQAKIREQIEELELMKVVDRPTQKREPDSLYDMFDRAYREDVRKRRIVATY